MAAPKIKSNPTKTVLTIVVGFLFIYLITHQKWSLTIAFFIGLIGIASDLLAKQIEWVWMKLALVLSYIVPNIVLTLIFYLFLYPIAVLNKIFGKKDPMNLKNTKSTLFKTNPKVFDKAYFEKHW
jgi:hypothetical protein